MRIKGFIFTILAFVLLLSGCNSNSESQETSKKEKTPSVPKEVFSSNKNNENINESEMKDSIKTYLDTYDSLYKNANKLRYKDNLSEKEAKKLNEITRLNTKNDKNFSNFIENNNIPKEYKSGAFKIKNYISSTNQLLEKLNNQVQKMEKNSESDDFSMSDVGKIEEINSKYKEKVNGKKQKEIENFLKDKDIKTKAFK